MTGAESISCWKRTTSWPDTDLSLRVIDSAGSLARPSAAPYRARCACAAARTPVRGGHRWVDHLVAGRGADEVRHPRGVALDAQAGGGVVLEPGDPGIPRLGSRMRGPGGQLAAGECDECDRCRGQLLALRHLDPPAQKAQHPTAALRQPREQGRRPPSSDRAISVDASGKSITCQVLQPLTCEGVPGYPGTPTRGTCSKLRRRRQP